MKKVLPLLMILFFVLPVISAFAYNGGLLEGVPTDSGVTQMTDNNFSSYKNVYVNNPQVFTFSENMDISKFFIKTGVTNDNSYILTLYFKGADGEILSEHKIGPDKEMTREINVKNVKSVVLDTPVASSNLINTTVFEFDLYGKVSGKSIEISSVLSLTETHNFNSVNLSWINPTSDDFDGVIIKQNGVEVTQLAKTSSSYAINGLDSDTTYTFDVIAKYTNGEKSSAESVIIVTDPMPEDKNPPGEISDLAFGVSSSGVIFTWNNPPDTDFSHLKIYRDGMLIENEFKANTYDVSNLVPNTTYVYKFVTVDGEGNSSSGYVQTIKTDIEVDNVAPASPSGLIVTDGNQSGRIVWDKNTEADLQGYNVYVNGIKHNSAMLLTNNYVLTGLENEESYSITVTAIDTSGNESIMSSTENLIPSEDSMPIFKATYDLKAVADGTGNWFLSLWPILAFAVGISLAFYIGNRIKSLFFA